MELKSIFINGESQAGMPLACRGQRAPPDRQYARTVSPHSKPVQHASAMSWRANAAITRAFGEKRKTGSGLLPVCICRVCFSGMQG